MATEFNTVSKESTFVFEEKKSRFIARVFSVYSKDEAEKNIEKVKKENEGARHNVYAWKLSDGTAGMSDDGEPHGTGGKPVMSVIDKKGLVCTLVVVTRYFGGILLGAPGLVRAYSSAAVGALDIAGVSVVKAYERLSLTCSYDVYGKVINYLEKSGIKTNKPIFSDKVEILFYILPDDKRNVTDAVTELCDGLVEIIENGNELIKSDIA